jgi:hypothetical protein
MEKRREERKEVLGELARFIPQHRTSEFSSSVGKSKKIHQ